MEKQGQKLGRGLILGLNCNVCAGKGNTIINHRDSAAVAKVAALI
jgi:hypothetical protein